ncbi:MAG TPA: DUF2877 domain-containing protein, partial [Anaerolineae bacterium]|nr:DUF2877 domain-containing protein [Anaerolineae bacterium]
NGPFSIVMADGGLFNTLSAGQPALANPDSLTVGNWQINLSAAKVWEPKLVRSRQPLQLSSAIAGIIGPYTHWPRLAEGNAFAGSANRLARAAGQLKQALVEYDRDESYQEQEKIEKVAWAAGQLAGLGSGLTPAGDDFLMGVMAALWLTGREGLLPVIAREAIPQTTMLSGAFLRAAAQGEFMEAWHTLTQALLSGESEAFRQAVKRVAQFGASSGLDALAGFATTLLSLANEVMIPALH